MPLGVVDVCMECDEEEPIEASSSTKLAFAAPTLSTASSHEVDVRVPLSSTHSVDGSDFGALMSSLDRARLAALGALHPEARTPVDSAAPPPSTGRSDSGGPTT